MVLYMTSVVLTTNQMNRKMWAQLKYTNRLVAKHAGFKWVSRKKNLKGQRDGSGSGCQAQRSEFHRWHPQCRRRKPITPRWHWLSCVRCVENWTFHLPQDFYMCAVMCTPIHTHTHTPHKNQSSKKKRGGQKAPPPLSETGFLFVILTDQEFTRPRTQEIYLHMPPKCWVGLKHALAHLETTAFKLTRIF